MIYSEMFNVHVAYPSIQKRNAGAVILFMITMTLDVLFLAWRMELLDLSLDGAQSMTGCGAGNFAHLSITPSNSYILF